MSRSEAVSTDGIAPAKRLAFWNDAACQALAAMSAEPRSPQTFSGRMIRGDIGELRFVEFSSDAAIVRSAHALGTRASEAHYFFLLQLTGESRSMQEGREVHLRPGDFTLCDSGRPHHLRFDDHVSTLTLRVSKASLARYIGSPETLIHRAVSGRSGPGALASNMLRQMWKATEDMIPPEVEARVAHVALELLACAYTGIAGARADEPALSSSLRVRILHYINDHLHDPELTPSTVARSFRITPRYLHRLFLQESETAARHILRRRIERARQALADPLLAGMSLTRISGELGFKSLPHFSHVFHDECGMSPSAYRNAVRSASNFPEEQKSVPSRTNS